MTELPDSYVNRIRQQLSDEFEDYIRSFGQKSYNGLRVNLLKLSPQRFEEISPFALQKIPWVTNGFYYEGEQPSKHPYYYAGLYYLQEPSAMTPASLLPVNPGDRVLDLCAAPGGKSTELAARLQGEGVLVSNDISNSRAKALLKNLELFGVRNAFVMSEAPAKLADYFSGYFDKILVDAPCSGEGMFRKSPAIIKNWEQYGVSYYQKLQMEILPAAIEMLRPGGCLLYSTCTFSPQENEGTIQAMLNQYPDMHLIPAISRQVQQEDRDFTGFSTGNPAWVPDAVGTGELVNTVRLWPHKIKGEGHFVALLQKDANAGTDNAAEQIQTEDTGWKSKRTQSDSRNSSKSLISEEASEFLGRLSLEIDVKRIQVRDDKLFLLPDCNIDMKGLRILRSGLFLGEMKKNRFEPSQALACALMADQYDAVYSLPAKDPDILRYLKCEALEAKKPCKDGWVLVCVDDYPLGWAKCQNNSLKNKYLPGWRYM